MQSFNKIICLIGLLICSISCSKNQVIPASNYECELSFEDSSSLHSKANQYQTIIDTYVAQGVLGVSVFLADEEGEFLGVGGSADLASGVDITSCNPFLLASITKTLTATLTMKIIEEGLLSLDDFITEHLDPSITDRLPNGNDVQLKHMLQHTAGFPDFYDFPYYFDNLNQEQNIHSQEDYLKYIYDQDPVGPVDGQYHYSNIGYTLTGMILEKVSGKTLFDLFEEKIFAPHNLTSGWYISGRNFPESMVRGYIDLNGSGEMVDSEFFYEEEVNSADGSIAMNAQDLGRFFKLLTSGQIISPASFETMQTWYFYPDNDPDDEEVAYGYGIDKYESEFGNGIGHTGAVSGFITFAQTYPDDERTLVVLYNAGPLKYGDAYIDLLLELREVLFE